MPRFATCLAKIAAGFGLGIIEQDRAGFIGLHRGGIDDRASGLEMRQRRADPERRVDIGFKGGVKVFGGESSSSRSIADVRRY
jgi:hypothetical protein